MGAAADRCRLSLGIAALALAQPLAAVAQTAVEAPAYVARGRQTEARQRAWHERIDRHYKALADTLRVAAPDVLATLTAPAPDIHGYQVLPTIVPDGKPSTPGTGAPLLSYSWVWSDTLIARETTALEGLEAGLAQVPAGADRARYEKLAADYRGLVGRRGLIDADVQYNWNWQASIHRDRPYFDRMKKVQDAALERQNLELAVASRDEAKLRAAAASRGLDATASVESITSELSARAESLTREIAASVAPPAPPDFLRLDSPGGGPRVVTVPLYTDITDATFVEAFRNAVETIWRARVGEVEFRLQLAISTMTPEQLYCPAVPAAAAPCAPPAKGAAINLDAHVARFPKSAVVLTTGATGLRLIAGRAVALGPYNIGAHALAHEFGHAIGFWDTYYRGYRDLGPDGYQITELAGSGDLMGDFSSVLPRHFEEMIAAVEARKGRIK